uniref:Uncharacterized protein n=1 Tax=Arundo donax TaxID=35708 RepID=A0A0A9AGX4_ARUDO
MPNHFRFRQIFHSARLDTWLFNFEVRT